MEQLSKRYMQGYTIGLSTISEAVEELRQELTFASSVDMDFKAGFLTACNLLCSEISLYVDRKKGIL